MACCIDKQNITVSEFVKSSWWKTVFYFYKTFKVKKEILC